MKTSHTILAGLVAAITLSSSVARAGSVLAPGTTPKDEGQHFVFDPISDGVITGGAFGFSLVLGAILGTGEIAPPAVGDKSKLLSIDQGAVGAPSKNAGMYSDIGLYTAVGFAVLDPVLSGFRDGKDAAVVDAFMYAESGSLALMLTDITKIAVRRPRPLDYYNCPPDPKTGAPNASADCKSTDLGLSFFSGHASTVAAMGATATYLAFVRSPHTARPWITLGLATALTAFVSYERVAAAEHFPTDVIVGSMAGAAVGIIVPHLHRHLEEAPPVWVGAAPVPGGGSVALSGIF